MNDMQQSLGLFIMSFGLGGVLIATLCLRQRTAQFLVATLVALTCFALFHPEEPSAPIIAPSLGLEFLIFLGAACLIVVVGNALIRALPDFTTLIATCLQPRLWTNPAATFTTLDVAKRWFVAVAAATGSLVFVLVTDPDFREALAKHLTIHRTLLTALTTLISLVLIGPVEEYIFASLPGGPEHSSDHPSHFERMMSHLSVRWLGRVLLIFTLTYALNLTHSCIEEALNNPAQQRALTIVLSLVPPAVITYFWCGALQSGTPYIASASTVGAVACGMLLYLPLGVLASIQGFAAIYPAFNPGPYAGILAMLAALFWALFMGGLLIGVPAVLGGLILSRRRNAHGSPLWTIASIGLAVIGGNIALLFVFLGIASRAGMLAEHPTLEDSYLPGIASTVGWGVGLLIAGFPDILRRAATPTGSPAVAAQPTT